MQLNELSLTGKLDNGLVRSLCWLLDGFKTAGLWLVGLFVLASLPGAIFEYDEGLADLSSLEWMFMPLLALLLWRHIHYASHFALGFWQGLHRLLIAQGVMFVLQLAVLGAVIALLLKVGSPEDFMQLMTLEHPVDKLWSYGQILLALYLGVPCAAEGDDPATLQAPAAAESTPLAKEASL